MPASKYLPTFAPSPTAHRTFFEPILAKRLDTLHVSPRNIGVIFSLSNIVYVPTVFLMQYFPRHAGRHKTITLSAMLTPIAVLLVGSANLALVVLGILLLGVFPTPTWVQLLPWLQEQSSSLYPDPTTKQKVNDFTASLYNLFMTLGQVVGYMLGPMLGSWGFTEATQIVGVLIFLQSLLFFFSADS